MNFHRQSLQFVQNEHLAFKLQLNYGFQFCY